MQGIFSTGVVAIIGATATLLGGCQESDRGPNDDVVIIEREHAMRRERDEQRPLPSRRDERTELPPPPFEDPPLVVHSPPEQREFLRAYDDVGRPTIAVFVNRSFVAEPLGKDVKGHGNELGTRSIDYEAMENILTDWLAADGRVEILSTTGVRERLSAGEARDLEDGDLKMNDETARRLDADVLVQVFARITKQTPEGPEVRLVSEAVNIRGGQSIGRAMVDVPAPLTKPQLNRYTRFVARKLMDGLTQTWTRMADEAPASRDDADRPAPQRRAVPNAPTTPRRPAAADPPTPATDRAVPEANTPPPPPAEVEEDRAPAPPANE